MTPKQYMDAVAALGCIACEKDGFYGTPAQLHHPRQGKGMAERGSDMEVYGLCAAHHLGQGQPRGFPSVHMNPKQFFARYGDEKTLSQEVRERVGSGAKRR